METNDCNKAIKIVTVLAIILFVFGASAIMERNQLQKENAQLKERSIVTIGVTNNLDQGWFGAEGISYIDSNNTVKWVYDNNTCVKIEYLPEYHPFREYEIVHQGILIHVVNKNLCENEGIIGEWQNKSNESDYKEIIPVTNTSENTSIAKSINFSLGREYVEAMLKQQNPNKTISFKEIRCDAQLTYYDPTTTENDGFCYVTYSLGDGNYTVVAVDKQYKDDWW